jgi:hypothetical protein
MNNEKVIRRIIIICFVILFILAVVVLVILQNSENEIEEAKIAISSNKQDIENNIYDDTKTYDTIENLLESYGCKLIKEVKSPTEMIYLKFARDLYELDGTSNKTYFESLINACAKKLVKEKFYLYDESKSIQILVKCDLEENTLTYKINNIENYFDKVNSSLYEELENTEIVDYQSIDTTYNILYKLIDNNMYIVDDLGKPEGYTEDRKYGYYLNQTIKARTFASKVRNIVFLPGYEEKVFNNIYVGMPLSKVAEKLETIAFGSVEEGFLGYRSKDVYVFFYEDEISVYGYSYYEHTEFEEYLEEYLQDGDLDAFNKNITRLWQSYDEYEYDAEAQNLRISYPYIGVEINIENNDSKGITLYSNYYFTNKTKRFIAEGKITLDSKTDAIYVSELNRRNNENN